MCGSPAQGAKPCIAECSYVSLSAHIYVPHLLCIRYETGGDLGRCLGPMNDGGGLASAPSGSAVSLVEGVMDDGTSCTMEVGE